MPAGINRIKMKYCSLLILLLLFSVPGFPAKYAEMLDAKREQVEVLLGSESFVDINARRSEIQKKIDKLQREANDLQKQTQKAMQ